MIDNECDLNCLKESGLDSSNCKALYNNQTIDQYLASSYYYQPYCNTFCKVTLLGNYNYDPECDDPNCLYDLGDMYYYNETKEFYVDSSSKLNGNGSTLSSYSSLESAFNSIRYGSTVIYLMNEIYYLNDSRGYFEKQFFYKLVIKPLFCTEVIENACIDNNRRPTIYLKEKLSTFVINADVEFDNINFAQKYNCKSAYFDCIYCGYIKNQTAKSLSYCN